MSANVVGIGVLGFGGFAMFAAQQFAQVPGVALRCIAGTHREASLACATRFGLVDLQRADVLFARPDVDLVYIATPPFLHYEQARAALLAGKHVIVEKPLAVTMEQADEIVSLARDTRRLLVTNLMQRYNPLFAKSRRSSTPSFSATCCAARSRTTRATKGSVRTTGSGTAPRAAGSSSSTACTSSTCSLAGSAAGRVESAGRVLRPGSGIEEQVYCTARYGDVPVNFYHGFTQAGRMDRQELRLLFERGDVTLREWIPTQAVVRTALDEGATRALASIFPGARIDVESLYASSERVLRARHKTYEAYQRITLTSVPATKMTVYGDLLRAMLDRSARVHRRALARAGDHGRQRARVTSNERPSHPARDVLVVDVVSTLRWRLPR